MSNTLRPLPDQTLRDKDGYLLDEKGSYWPTQRSDIPRERICCDQLYEHLISDVYVRYDSSEGYTYLVTRNPYTDGFSYCPFCGVNVYVFD